MGADSVQKVIDVAGYLGLRLTNYQKNQLVRYHRWLLEEAIPAGGIGPHESDRLWNRHIGDSLLFAIGFGEAGRCLDIGTGVGLPGIPLAIAFPDIEIVLLDRAGRRCDLVRRATAVLGLENCTVIQGDVQQVSERFESIVSRAAIPPGKLMIHVKRLLAPGGVAILGLTRASDGSFETPECAQTAVSVEAVSIEILDTPAHLLRIEAT